MTWAALTLRTGGFAFLLPLALSRLSSAEVSVWLLFSTVASLQMLLDFGFSATFSREIAYGFAGSSTLEVQNPTAGLVVDVDAAPQTNWSTVGQTLVAMRWLYRRMGFGMAFLLLLPGSIAVMGPIGRIANPVHGWLSWFAVVAATSCALYSNANSTLLVGANRVDLLKKWDAVNAFFFLPLQMIVLLWGGGLLGLVIAGQVGVLAKTFVNSQLASRIIPAQPDATEPPADTEAVLRGLWPAAWRTALGAITSFGVSQGATIVIANLLVAGEAASVQLALRVMQIVSQFSQVPFYTRIPVFNRLRASRQDSDLIRLAIASVQLSLWILVASVIFIGLLAPTALSFIGSRTSFPSPLFWGLLGMACLFERIGGMHVQLLMTNNKLIAHVANTTTAVLWIGCLFLLWPKMGALALPVSMMISYAGFYAPWSSHRSRAELGAAGGWIFELRTSFLPLIVLLAYVAGSSLLRSSV